MINTYRTPLTVILTVVFLLTAFSVSTPSVSADTQPNTEITTTPDVILLVDEGSLTIYIASEQPVSLDGFEFAVRMDGEFVTLNPEIRFGVLDPALQGGILESGTCLVYLYDDEIEPSEMCAESDTYISHINHAADRFWMDGNNNRRDVFIFRDGTTTRQKCLSQDATCPIYYNTTRPLEVREVTLPDSLLPRTTREDILPIKTLSSSSGQVNDVTWNPDNSVILSAHDNGDICMWNPTGTDTDAIACQVTHQGSVTALDWDTSDSREAVLVSSGIDGFVRYWQVVKSTPPHLRSITERERSYDGFPLLDLKSNPANTTFVTADEPRPVIRDFMTGELVRTFNTSGPIGVDWDGSGEYLVALGAEGVIRVIDTLNRENFVNLGTITADGADIEWNKRFDQIAVADADGKVLLYDYTPGNLCPNNICNHVTIAQNLPGLSQVRFSPTGTKIAIAHTSSVHIMDAQGSHNLLNVYTSRSTQVTHFTAVVWQDTEERLIAGDSEGNIYIWEVQTDTQTAIEIEDQWDATNRGAVVDLSWHPDGRAIAVLDENLNLLVWSPTGEPVGTDLAHTDDPLAVDWNTSQTELVATGGCGPLATVWRFTAKPEEIIREDFDTSNCVTAIAFNHRGDLLVTADQGGLLTVWQWHDTLPIEWKPMNLNGSQEINDIEWHISDRYLASVDDSGVLKVFDMTLDSTPIVFQRETGHIINSVSWSADGSHIATGQADGLVVVWEWEDAPANTNTRYNDSYLLDVHQHPVITVDWSKNDDLLISLDESGLVVIWDAHTGQQIAQTMIDGEPTHAAWVPVEGVPVFAVSDTDGKLTLFGLIG